MYHTWTQTGSSSCTQSGKQGLCLSSTDESNSWRRRSNNIINNNDINNNYDIINNNIINNDNIINSTGFNVLMLDSHSANWKFLIGS